MSGRPCDAWDSCPNPDHAHNPTERRKIALRAVRAIAVFVNEFDLTPDEARCFEKAIGICLREAGTDLTRYDRRAPSLSDAAPEGGGTDE